MPKDFEGGKGDFGVSKMLLNPHLAKDFEGGKGDFGVAKMHLKPHMGEKQARKEKAKTARKGQTHKSRSRTHSSSAPQPLKNVSDISDDESLDTCLKSKIVLKSPDSKVPEYPDLSPVSDSGDEQKDPKSMMPSGRPKQRSYTEPESKLKKVSDEPDISSDKLEIKAKALGERGLADIGRKRKIKLRIRSHSSLQPSKLESDGSPPKKRLKVFETIEPKREHEKKSKKSMTTIAMPVKVLGGTDKLWHQERSVDEEQMVGKESEKVVEKDQPQKSRSKEKDTPEKEKRKEREKEDAEDKVKRSKGERDWTRGDKDKGSKGEREKGTKGEKAKKERDKAEKSDIGKWDKERMDKRDRSHSGKEEKSKAGKGDKDRDKGTKVERLESLPKTKDEKREKDKADKGKIDYIYFV